MALYNNGYPATYTPYYSPVQMQQQPVQPQQPVQNGIIWVSGEAGAKAYLVAPNNTVQLWDSEAQCIYLKSADASGLPSMKVLDYTIREPGKNAPVSSSAVTMESLSEYATKDEIKAVSEQITALKKRVEKLTKKQEAEDDE